MRVFRILFAALLLSAPLLAGAVTINCNGGAPNVEEFRYTWHLRGGVGWLAGLFFPNRGVAALKTTFSAEQHQIASELMMTADDGSQGFYRYESQMDDAGQKTFMTYHGYAWGKKMRKERTLFDYTKRLARTHSPGVSALTHTPSVRVSSAQDSS